MQTIIAYDITDSRRRDKVSRLLADSGGTRIQFSVFEIDLQLDEFQILQNALAGLIRPRRDRLHFYPLCKTCFAKATSLGQPYQGDLPPL